MPEERASPVDLSLRPDVLQALRTATAPLHRRLDSGLPIAREDASLADYVAHLRVLQRWLLALRRGLAAGGPEGPGAVAGHVDARLADLASDLADAGHPVPRAGIPSGGADAGHGGAAYAWGLAYVVEGSQLGGAVLHRRLRERLAPHPLRYLASEGQEAGVAARWRDFILRLRERVADPASIRQAERGAVAAFEDLVARFGL